MWAGTLTTSPLEPTFVASRINYLSIGLFCGLPNAGGRKGRGLGRIPQWVGFTFSVKLPVYKKSYDLLKIFESS